MVMIEEDRALMRTMRKRQRKWIGHMLRGWRPAAKNDYQRKDGGKENTRKT